MSGAKRNEQLAVSGAASRAPSVVVTGGGEPSPEELAALVIALTPVVVPAAQDEEAPVRGPRGWRRAGLIEGVGGRAPVSHPDLVGGRFGLGHVGDPAVHP